MKFAPAVPQAPFVENPFGDATINPVGRLSRKLALMATIGSALTMPIVKPTVPFKGTNAALKPLARV